MTFATPSRDDGNLRASDRERERTVSILQAHAGEGRLTLEELEERTTAAYAAKTKAELKALRADLPKIRTPEQEARRRQQIRAGVTEHVLGYVGTMMLLIAVWALTGMGYFWPIWPIMGWGVGVISHVAPVMRLSRPRPSIGT